MTVQIDEAPAAADVGAGDPENKIHVLCMRCKKQDMRRARQTPAVCGYVKPGRWRDSLEEADGKPKEFCRTCENALDKAMPCSRCGARPGR